MITLQSLYEIKYSFQKLLLQKKPQKACVKVETSSYALEMHHMHLRYIHASSGFTADWPLNFFFYARHVKWTDLKWIWKHPKKMTVLWDSVTLSSPASQPGMLLSALAGHTGHSACGVQHWSTTRRQQHPVAGGAMTAPLSATIEGWKMGAGDHRQEIQSSVCHHLTLIHGDTIFPCWGWFPHG